MMDINKIVNYLKKNTKRFFIIAELEDNTHSSSIGLNPAELTSLFSHAVYKLVEDTVPLAIKAEMLGILSLISQEILLQDDLMVQQRINAMKKGMMEKLDTGLH
jgi:hypothetical protein